jgi:hypothetical protein
MSHVTTWGGLFLLIPTLSNSVVIRLQVDLISEGNHSTYPDKALTFQILSYSVVYNTPLNVRESSSQL